MRVFKGLDRSSTLIETERCPVDGIDIVASGEQHVEWASVESFEIATFENKRSWKRSIKVHGSALNGMFDDGDLGV